MKKKLASALIAVVMSVSMFQGGINVKAETDTKVTSDYNSTSNSNYNTESTGLKKEDKDGKKWLSQNVVNVENINELNKIINDYNSKSVNHIMCFSRALSANNSDTETLPSKVDNSTSSAFPAIMSQGRDESCVCCSTAYYQMTYNYNKLHGTSAKTPDNICSPNFLFNLLNSGVNYGTTISDNLKVLTEVGAATQKTVPVSDPYSSTYYSNYHANEEAFKDANLHKIKCSYDIDINKDGKDTPISGPDDANLKAIKYGLAHGQIYSFSTDFDKFTYRTIARKSEVPANDGYVGQTIVPMCCEKGTGGHHMTIVGYNDDIWFDINKNGQVEDAEKGAFKVANSWGTDYKNNGFVWISYDALNKVSKVNNDAINSNDRKPVFNDYKVYGFTVKDDNELSDVYLKIQLNTSLRCNACVEVSDINGTKDKVTMIPLDGTKGGNYGFDGTKTSSTGTFILDLSNYDSNITYDDVINNGIKVTISDLINDNVPLKVLSASVINKNGDKVTNLLAKEQEIDGNSIELFSKETDKKTVQNLSLSYNSGMVSIKYDAPDSKDSIKGYEIYRNTVLLQSTTSTLFNDYVSFSGKLNYMVRVVYNDGTYSPFSKASINVNNKSQQYDPLKPGEIVSDKSSPAVVNDSINLYTNVKGGSGHYIYQYFISSPTYGTQWTTAYGKNNSYYCWKPDVAADWDVMCSVSDLVTGEYVTVKTKYKIVKDRLKITSVNFDKDSPAPINSVINMKVNTNYTDESSLNYSATIYKEGQYVTTLYPYYSNNSFEWNNTYNTGDYNIQFKVKDNSTGFEDVKNVEYTIKNDDLKIENFKAYTGYSSKEEIKTAKAGTSFYLKADVTGGNSYYGQYTYSYTCLLDGKEYDLSSCTNNSINGNVFEKPGKYLITCNVSDRDGNTVSKSLEINITQGDLNLYRVYMNDYKFNYGDTVEIEASAKYALGDVYYKVSDESQIGTKVVQDFDKNNKISWIPNIPGKHVVTIEAKDDRDKVVKETCYYSIDYEDLTINSFDFVGKDTCKPGETVKVALPNVSGGFGKYSYDIYALDSSNNKYPLTKDEDGNYIFVPAKAGMYHIHCEVTDEMNNNRIDSLDLKVQGDKELVINSLGFIGDNNYKTGDTVNISSNVTGGSGSYNYNVYALDEKGNKNYLNNNGDGTFSFVPKEEGKYTIKFSVTDEIGDSKSKDLELNVIKVEKLVISSLGFVGDNNYKAGDTVKISSNVTGGYGNYNYDVYALDEAGNKSSLTKNEDGTFSFVSEKEGKYTIKFSVTDELQNNATKDLELNVSSKNVVTIYYNGFQNPYIHYRIGDGQWTNVPGVPMNKSTEISGYNYEITINLEDAQNLTACFNNGNGQWDSNGGRNYTFTPGKYTYSNGTITKIDHSKEDHIITLYYKGFNTDSTYAHYRIGNGNWTNVPGVLMNEKSDAAGYAKLTINLGSENTLTACFNNGNGAWDNNGNKNYYFGSDGTYYISDHNITKIN